MRVGEQLRLAETAKQTVSAPRPSSGSLRSPPVPTLFVPSGHFPLIGGIGPQGKLWALSKSALHQKSAAACRFHLPNCSFLWYYGRVNMGICYGNGGY